MALILVLLGIAGLIVEPQFGGQETLSWVLIGVGAFLTLLQIVWFAFVASKAKREFDRFDRKWGQF